MDPSTALMLTVGGIVSAVFIIMGIRQILSKTPVAFYTGEEPPLESHLKSVRGWNTCHGLLWIWYGLVMISCFLAAAFLTIDSLYKSLILFAAVIIPLFMMVIGHHLLIRIYLD